MPPATSVTDSLRGAVAPAASIRIGVAPGATGWRQAAGPRIARAAVTAARTPPIALIQGDIPQAVEQLSGRTGSPLNTRLAQGSLLTVETQLAPSVAL